MNFFIVVTFSLLRVIKTKKLTYCYRNTASLSAFAHFLDAQPEACDNKGYCGASVARNFSNLLGEKMHIFPHF
jgi:hypothetical protein